MLQLFTGSVVSLFATLVAFVSQMAGRVPASPDTAAHYAGLSPANIATAVGDVLPAGVANTASGAFDVIPTMAYSLSISLNTSSMFDGAQLIIDALGGPYLYIAGLALGASILGAIIAAVSRIRI
jgi:hypothetical protein